MTFKYYKLSADKGNVLAYRNVGMCYLNGIGTDKNPSLTYKYYKLAADSGLAAG